MINGWVIYSSDFKIQIELSAVLHSVQMYLIKTTPVIVLPYVSWFDSIDLITSGFQIHPNYHHISLHLHKESGEKISCKLRPWIE